MSSPSSSWLDALPLDFYDQLAHCLSLHGMAAAELFSRPDTDFSQQLHELTALDSADVQRLNTIQDHTALLAALRTEPLALYHLLLLGRLTLQTSLAVPVLAYVQQQMHIQEEQLMVLNEYCLELSGAFLTTLEEHVPAPAGAASLGLHRLQIEEVFAQYIAHIPAPVPPVANLNLSEPQLQMLRLSLLLVHSLPQAADHPFMRAVGQLKNLQPEALEPLLEHLGRAHAQEQLSLTMPELIQLYQGMQVCGMVFVSDIMARIGLEELFPTLPTDADPATAEAAPASHRQAVGEMVTGFTRWVQHTFPNDPEIAKAREEVMALADLL
ncbi:hypothetical protein HMJ29_03385 [Hymenobacter taeanensis]|uniref:Uncharacterized protein n=1 Tax=Hymenobacter taeanensis TaxID=2735321 RepID=A0A6M6BDG7_9BACT|nr:MULTISPECIES: hypothetical protein [Hymenobacter]QJX46029.1 hypothetical protein HMJ29_03385 [Hymenobacter taeanensis]UOQ79883.1 hypothetical protein MUN83_13640 [Hymenobacter sp. 5414T-23]